MAKGDFKIAPLTSSFFFTSIVGFYISLIWMVPKAGDSEFIAKFAEKTSEEAAIATAQAFTDFGVAFALVFGIMFIASMISLTYAPAKALLRLEQYEKTHKGAKEISHKDFVKEYKAKKKKSHK